MKLTLKPLIAIAVILVTALSSCQKTPVDYSKDINDLKALVSELQQRSDSLAIALGNTNTNLSNLSKSVDSIKVKLTDIQTQIDALTLSLTTANANIAAINAQLILLNQQYASLLEQLNAILAQLNSAPATLSDGLVAYFPFNGNAGDSSGNGHHGTVNGATLTADRFGKLNKAYSFDGISNFINVSSSTDLDLSGSEFSISVWIKNFGQQSSDRIVLCKSEGGGSQNKWALLTTNTSLIDQHPGISLHSYPAIAVSGNNWINSDVFNTEDTTTWKQCIISKTLNTVKIFLDGTLVKTESINSNFVAINSDLRIGGDEPNGGGYWFNGKIDDVRIYNRALNQSEITFLATH